jgi:hypothetical protein
VALLIRAGPLFEGYMADFVKHVTDTLDIVDSVSPVYIHQVSQGGVLEVMQIIQVVTATLIKNPLNQSVHHEILVSETLTSSGTKVGNDAVTVTQSIGVSLDTQRSVTQSLTFNQFVVARLDRSYHYVPPEIPEVQPPDGPATPTDPPPQPNMVNIDSPVFTLWLADDVLELRLPRFGDKDKYEATRVKRNTRGGTLIVYRDPMWPEREILSVEFDWLSAGQVADLLLFMHTHLGRKINLKDQFARTFQGFIITPESEVAQPKRKGYTAKFDFQIYQVPPT